ncbi:uncharacterized protein [Penaeus vannamei]|uniref:uncharacterized protein n=1 Tax=Penaeus vannamei TaxID=6689 RepID=UPI00387F6DBF
MNKTVRESNACSEYKHNVWIQDYTIGFCSLLLFSVILVELLSSKLLPLILLLTVVIGIISARVQPQPMMKKASREESESSQPVMALVMDFLEKVQPLLEMLPQEERGDEATNKIPGNNTICEAQKMALLGTAHRRRKELLPGQPPVLGPGQFQQPGFGPKQFQESQSKPVLGPGQFQQPGFGPKQFQESQSKPVLGPGQFQQPGFGPKQFQESQSKPVLGPGQFQQPGFGPKQFQESQSKMVPQEILDILLQINENL